MQILNFINVIKADVEGFNTVSKILIGVNEPIAIAAIGWFALNDGIFNTTSENHNQLLGIGVLAGAVLISILFSVYRVYKTKKIMLIACQQETKKPILPAKNREKSKDYG